METGALIGHSNSRWAMENIQYWEEAGAELEVAISAYHHACLSLEHSSSTAPSIHTATLPARLGRRIEYFNALLTQPLAQSLASIARSRNRLTTSCYRIPPEILSKIFEFVIEISLGYVPMGVAFKTICLSLYRILSVCSVWRKVGMAHASLWTLVPLVYFNTPPRGLTERSVDHSLTRAGRVGLRLAADIRDFSINHLSIRTKLVSNGHRFRFINIRASSLPALEAVLQPILTTAVPSSIHELSLCFEPPLSNDSRIHGPHYLFRSGAPFVKSAIQAVSGFARVLRFKNVLPPTASHYFNNVVELRIQDIVFGDDATLRQFLWSLSIATRLRTLDIISITAYEATDEPAFAHNIPFSLPSLQSIYLENLPLNVLGTLLHAIEPGPHNTALLMTNRSFSIIRPNGVFQGNLASFGVAIQSHTIGTLVLNKHFTGPNAGSLHSILGYMPALTAIIFDEQTLDRESLLVLTRPPATSVTALSFPKLRRILLSCTIIDDIGNIPLLKTMLSSHPLQELVIGGSFQEIVEITAPNNVRNRYRNKIDLDGPDVRATATRAWLKEHVPNYILIAPDHHAGFRSNEWLL
ncbi:unnamed protein product [Rhizoctonia solani]|uniref:F-box domain-containing protein n=1 Tax=Rhizoctonia solani TaxID=456999 RepID=A0A8H2ZV40_9AGAM|nr:unnamed protein product [Rhizoctonia solani]